MFAALMVVDLDKLALTLILILPSNRKCFQKVINFNVNFFKNTSGAEKKKSAVQHDNVAHLLGEENEGEDRNGFCQENEEVNNTEQCYKPPTPQAKVSLK